MHRVGLSTVDPFGSITAAVHRDAAIGSKSLLYSDDQYLRRAVHPQGRQSSVRDLPPRRDGGSRKRHPAAAVLLSEFCWKICCGPRTGSASPGTTSRRWPGGRRRSTPTREIAFTPARVLLQDFTGVPAVVDLAAMRDAMAELGGDPGGSIRSSPSSWWSTTRSRSTPSAPPNPSRPMSISTTSGIGSGISSCAGASARSRTSGWSHRTPVSSIR